MEPSRTFNLNPPADFAWGKKSWYQNMGVILGILSVEVYKELKKLKENVFISDTLEVGMANELSMNIDTLGDIYSVCTINTNDTDRLYFNDGTTEWKISIDDSIGKGLIKVFRTPAKEFENDYPYRYLKLID